MSEKMVLKKVLVGLPNELLEILDEVARCDMRTRSSAVREGIRLYIAKTAGTGGIRGISKEKRSATRKNTSNVAGT